MKKEVRKGLGLFIVTFTATTAWAQTDIEVIPQELEIGQTVNNLSCEKKKVAGDVIFFEDFEKGLPATWTVIDNDGDGYNWKGFINNGTENKTNTHSGDGAVASSSYEDYAPLKPDNWLVTPQLNLQGTMKVWLCAQDINYSDEHFAIYLSTTGTNIADFKTVLVDESIATSNYVEYSADLSAFTGQQGYIAIRHFNCSDNYRLNVDDFGIFGGDTNSIMNTTSELQSSGNKNVYTLDGRRVKGKPNAKGVYIHHGKKIVLR